MNRVVVVVSASLARLVRRGGHELVGAGFRGAAGVAEKAVRDMDVGKVNQHAGQGDADVQHLATANHVQCARERLRIGYANMNVCAIAVSSVTACGFA